MKQDMTKMSPISLILCASLSACIGAEPSFAASPILGFSIDGAATQRAVELKFDRGLSASAIMARIRSMASAPNPIGSPHNKAIAYETMELLRAWGWNARVESFSVRYPSPSQIMLQLVAPQSFSATLSEPAVPGDPLSANRNDVLPSYLVYGGDGDVTAPVIYVNYGMEEDYAALSRLGITVKGKIVIARFGAGWRGLKPKLAYEHGAIGCIIYSDPADDGYEQGDVYPVGAWRPAHSVQRGSVIDLPVAPGDPLRPQSAQRQPTQSLSPSQASAIMKLPVLPISYADAQHFLSALGGPVAPTGWRGALPITYHIGPGPARAHLVAHFRWKETPFYNVIAVMKGSTWPDQWVIRGNNRDTWVYGAWDSLSGHSAMLEEARSIGALAHAGWKPKRTIVLASWDGEEAGLIGSVNWVEANAPELKAKAVLYINSGPNGRGYLEASASYSISSLINQAADDVQDPEVHASVRARALATSEVQRFETDSLRPGEDLSAAGLASGAMPIGDMGAGSDYAPFLQHLGIASIDLGFRGEDQGFATAHSIYDDFQHFQRFSDPRGDYALALAQIAGRLTLRCANADILPLTFDNFSERISAQVADLTKLVTTMGKNARVVNQLLDSHAFVLASDPMKVSLPPNRAKDIPAIDLSPLSKVAAELKNSAKAYDAALARVGGLSPAREAQLNALLQGLEQRLVDPRGLPGRPWYRHLLYEPGMRTGYAPSTLPGVREALESGRWREAREYINKTAKVLEDYRRGIDEATMLLKG